MFASDQCLGPCACPIKNICTAADRIKMSREKVKYELLLKIGLCIRI